MPPLTDAVIFCDDIREETGNKVTLVGIYGKRLFLPKDAKFPAGIRQLCVYIRLTGVRGGETLRVTVSRDSRTVFELPESAPIKTPNYPDEYSSVSLYLVPFAFESVGEYTFGLYWANQTKPFREEVLQVLFTP